MNEPTITCPTCETAIPLTPALARPYIEAERAKLDREVRERAAAIEKRESALREKSAQLGELERSLATRANELESVIEERLKEARAAIIAAEAKKAETRYEARLAEARREQEAQSARIAELQQAELKYRAKMVALDEERRNLDRDLARKLAEQTDHIRAEATKEERERNRLELESKDEALGKMRVDLAQARDAELEVRRQRHELEDEKRAFELEVARKLDEERRLIREATQKEDDERHRLKLAEKDKVIEQMARQVDELRRKIDQGSQQVQGEVLEQDLREIIEYEFGDDNFEDVPTGQPGSDVIQRVKLDSGADCGSIIWESKNTKNWNDGWLAKVRKDQRDNSAAMAVIVSTSLPKAVDGFDRIDDVWVTGRRHAVALAKALRQALIDNRQIRLANEDRYTKADRVYTYITTKEFHQRITAVVEAYVAMRESLDSEKRAIQRQWAKREKELESLLISTARLYGDLQGIVGKSMPMVEALRLPGPEGLITTAEVSSSPQRGPQGGLSH